VTARFGPKIAALDDIVVTTKGNSTGRVGRIGPREVGAVYSPHLSYWRARDLDQIDPNFLYYWSRSLQFRSQLSGMSTSTDMAPYLSLRDQLSLRITLPPVASQREIGRTLRVIDDKIELNRRMNETLEAMAQAVFRDWFIDFGPVRRKLAGVTDPVEIMGGLTPDPIRAAALAGLFPDTLTDEELPEGWNETPLSSQMDIIGGGTPKTSVAEYWSGSIPWFSVVDTPSGSDIFVFDTEKSITERGLSESSTRLIPSGTTIISARGTVGNLAIAAGYMAFNQSCYALRSARGEHPFFIYLSVAHAIEQLRSMAHGSVFSTITRQTFDALSFPSPPLPVLAAVEAVLAPTFDRLKAAVAENRTLAETRDYLLPRLMSGAVRVADAEAMVGSR
jgi:type I restriction enzyme S subunit